MSLQSEFFLNSKSNVVQYELLEISHPNFTQVYYMVRNAVGGITVTLENAASQAFVYYPLRITGLEERDNLDYGIRVDLGDVGEVLPKELDAAAGNMGTKPTVKYRTYRSDDLSAPIFGPIILKIDSITFNKTGCSFDAKAPSVSINKTGEVYTLSRFQTLRGFL